MRWTDVERTLWWRFFTESPYLLFWRFRAFFCSLRLSSLNTTWSASRLELRLVFGLASGTPRGLERICFPVLVTSQRIISNAGDPPHQSDLRIYITVQSWQGINWLVKQHGEYIIPIQFLAVSIVRCIGWFQLQFVCNNISQSNQSGYQPK